MSIPLGVFAYQSSQAPQSTRSKPQRSEQDDRSSKRSKHSDSTSVEHQSDTRSPRSISVPQFLKGRHRKRQGSESTSSSQVARTDSIQSKDSKLSKPSTTASSSAQDTDSPAEDKVLTLPSITSIGSLSIPSFPSTPRKSPPAPIGHKRHVEIVIPPCTQAVDPDLASILPKYSPPKSAPIDSTVHKNTFVPNMSQLPSSRTSTLDSNTSAPSPVQLSSRNGVGHNPPPTSRSHSSLGKRDGYDSSSEHESVHSAHRGTPHQTQPSSISPVAGPAGHSTAAASNLSGLVCNVHRTTGKEPHALVGATTTILGDKLYVFGGRRISRTRPTLTSDLYELDLLHRHWSKIDASGDIPPSRYFHSMCALGDNKLVCYGGMSPDPNSPSANANGQGDQSEAQVSVMSDVHIYDVPTRKWMKVNTTDNPQGRYAHCAAILPSSAVFASANAPMSAIQHNPSGSNPNQGSLGVSLDGTGGAEMVVVGGQDSGNHYIEQISVFNLRSLKWTSTKPMLGRSCGAYRSVVTPLPALSTAQVGAGPERPDEDYDDGDDESDLSASGSPMLIYTNYNFLDVKLELQVRSPDGSLTDKPMQGNVSPPGLRFPSGGIIDNNFVVAGTFLTSSKQEYALWSLDLRTLTWARIDTGSSVFSQGSWNRGVLWNRRNAFVILGNRKRNLVDDYNNRRLNFSNICLVQLEAFGLYDNPRKAAPSSDYISVSAALAQRPADNESASGGRQLSQAAIDLGELSSEMKELADMDFISLDGTRLPVNSRMVARRWGPSFNAMLHEGISSLADTDTSTLRPGATSVMSRNSSITITASVNTGYSNATTLTANSANASNAAAQKGLTEPIDPRTSPPNGRARALYLPHTVPTLQALIHYLYTSSLPVSNSALATPQILCSLLQLARPYKIDGLLEAGIQRLHQCLDGRNAAAIFNAAAMGAGGGEGLIIAAENTSMHPPRMASLVGINMEGVGSQNAGTGGRGVLRIDTDMANGVGAEGHTDDDDDVPDSASTTASVDSQLSLPRHGSRRGDGQVWNGGWSAVIGLQKRGLRGLMEGRRIRERGRSDGTPTNVENVRVGLGIA